MIRKLNDRKGASDADKHPKIAYYVMQNKLIARRSSSHYHRIAIALPSYTNACVIQVRRC